MDYQGVQEDLALEWRRCALRGPEAAASLNHAAAINTSKQSPKQGCAVSPPPPEHKHLPFVSPVCFKHFDEVSTLRIVGRKK